MAKIKINKLPEGFELKDGKVVEVQSMKDGGLVTGDQADYGLVTTPQSYYGETSFNNSSDESVRYSLSAVPRENANIEAEGGETVLTDLNDDGDFGLYNITGPRHSKGGVPMFLPEQSFIYSDTPKLKFTFDEMAEFDIGGSKRKTPAKISNMFGLNDFYAELDSEYADNISSRSAELMLKKNMEDLSKLAFMQESKKNFEDGVPLASHPYLMSIGIDPLEFTAQMEQISMAEAQRKAIEALSPAQREQLQYLQMMIQQAQAQEGQGQQSNEMAMTNNEGPVEEMDLASANNDMMQTAKFGTELTDFMRRAQEGPGTDDGNKKRTYDIMGREVDRATYVDYIVREGMIRGIDGKLNEVYDNFDWTEEEKRMYGKALQPEVPEGWDPFNRKLEGDLSVSGAPTSTPVGSGGGGPTVEGGPNETTSTSVNSNFKNPYPVGSEEYKKLEKYNSEGYTITEKDGKIRIYKPGTSKFDVQGETVIGDYEFVGTGETDIYTEDIAGQGDVVAESGIGAYRKGMYAGKRPEHQGAIYNNQIVDGVYDPSIKKDKNSGIYAYGSPAIKSEEAKKDFELRWGDITSQIDGFDFNADANDPQWLEFQNLAEETRKKEAEQLGIPYVPYFKKKGSEGYVKGEDWDGAFGLHTFNTPRLDVDYTPEEEIFMDVPPPPPPPIVPPEIPEEDPGVPKRWWAQDENNLLTLAALDDTLRLPFAAPLEMQNIDYVLDDWTGAVGANNAALNTMANALTAAGGPQALLRSNVFGKTLDANAKAINQVNQNNVKTMNRVATMQPQLDLTVGRLNNALMQGLYDNTQLALENYEQNANKRKIKANELFNTGATNAANTYNLNQLYDSYNINPTLYGNVEFTQDGRQLYETNQTDLLNDYYNRVVDYENKTGQPMPGDIQESLYKSMGLGAPEVADGTTVGQEELNRRGITGYPGSIVTNNEEVKKGKEKKKLPKWAVPFYSGKMGT